MIDVVVAGTIYVASLVGCYDGDTCKINVPSFVPFQEYSLRFTGFDTPEMRGKCAEEKVMANQAKHMTIEYMKTVKTIYVSGKGKYGRLLTTVPGLGEKLIEEGLARPYEGGKRASWCE
jgi:micrococcal nuclease